MRKIPRSSVGRSVDLLATASAVTLTDRQSLLQLRGIELAALGALARSAVPSVGRSSERASTRSHRARPPPTKSLPLLQLLVSLARGGIERLAGQLDVTGVGGGLWIVEA